MRGNHRKSLSMVLWLVLWIGFFTFALREAVSAQPEEGKGPSEEGIKGYFDSILVLSIIGICIYIGFKRAPKDQHKEVDTSRVAILGFSLISIVVLSFVIGYFVFRSVVNYQMDHLMYQYPSMNGGTVALLIFALPLIISLVLWYLLPSIIIRWYALKPLPSEYKHVHDSVQKIALRMGIPPPAVLYTQRDIANCFNIGKREGESALVTSDWLMNHLDMNELETVFAHEMAHTKNRDVTLMAYLAVARRILLLFPILILAIFLNSVLRTGYPDLLTALSPFFWLPIIFLFALYFLLVLGIQWFSRLREATADAQASLVVDKHILKRVLYKLANARSARMLLVSSSLMISGTRRFEGVFSAHPPIYKRYEMLDKKKHIIDYEKPLSLRGCFTTALSIYVFLQLINYGFSALVLGVKGDLPQGALVYFLNPVIIATLFVLYYDFISLKYVGIIPLLIGFLQFAVFLVLGVPSFLFGKYVVAPTVKPVPSGVDNVMVFVAEYTESFSEMIRTAFLVDLLLFSVITVVAIILFRYCRGMHKKPDSRSFNGK